MPEGRGGVGETLSNGFCCFFQTGKAAMRSDVSPAARSGIFGSVKQSKKASAGCKVKWLAYGVGDLQDLRPELLLFLRKLEKITIVEPWEEG